MDKSGKLILEDGSVYEGHFLGENAAVGEVVFTTGMTGYQESLTDPSFCGQIVVMTYPLIGNYGVNKMFMQSEKSYFRGFVISELCDHPSNWRSEGTLAGFLLENNVPCLYGVDTRAVTRQIRDKGVMRGVIVPEDTSEEIIKELLYTKETENLVETVTAKAVAHIKGDGKKVAVMDFGIKQSMIDCIKEYGCDIKIYPASASASEILKDNPEGIFLSNGPGDPKDLVNVIENIKVLIKSQKPIFGICLGYQLICLAYGADTYKMKFGHRGVNHSVKDLETGKVSITSQNHGYAVREETLLSTGLVVTHVNVNDETLEGVKHTSDPVFAVQYHPEASPGPDGNEYLFDNFYKMMGGQ